MKKPVKPQTAREHLADTFKLELRHLLTDTILYDEMWDAIRASLKEDLVMWLIPYRGADIAIRNFDETDDFLRWRLVDVFADFFDDPDYKTPGEIEEDHMAWVLNAEDQLKLCLQIVELAKQGKANEIAPFVLKNTKPGP